MTTIQKWIPAILIVTAVAATTIVSAVRNSTCTIPTHGTIAYMQTHACVDIDPNTLNLNSRRKYITCYIELPESYDVNHIIVASVSLNGTIPAQSEPTAIGDHDEDGVQDLMVKFDMQALAQFIRDQRIENGEVTLIITGEFDGTILKGADTIRVTEQ